MMVDWYIDWWLYKVLYKVLLKTKTLGIYYIILYYIILYCIILYYIVLYYIILHQHRLHPGLQGLVSVPSCGFWWSLELLYIPFFRSLMWKLGTFTWIFWRTPTKKKNYRFPKIKVEFPLRKCKIIYSKSRFTNPWILSWCRMFTCLFCIIRSWFLRCWWEHHRTRCGIFHCHLPPLITRG